MEMLYSQSFLYLFGNQMIYFISIVIRVKHAPCPDFKDRWHLFTKCFRHLILKTVL